MGGAIQTSQEELNQFFALALPGFLDYVKLHSDRLSTVEKVTTLEGIYSLTAYYMQGGVEKTVLAPLTLLTANVDEQAQAALAAATKANAAAEACVTATQGVTDAVNAANSVKDACVTATADARSAAADCRSATEATIQAKADIEANEAARVAAETSRVTAESTRESNETVRKSNEADRKSAENTRASNETTRISNETARNTAETARATAETARANAEATREANESTRKSNETTREANETVRKANEAARVAEYSEMMEHPMIIGDNFNWWRWDLATHKYVDTGMVAKGLVVWPTFYIDPKTMVLYVDDHAGSVIGEGAFFIKDGILYMDTDIFNKTAA